MYGITTRSRQKGNLSRLSLHAIPGTGQDLLTVMQEQRSTYEEKRTFLATRTVWPMRRESWVKAGLGNVPMGRVVKAGSIREDGDSARLRLQWHGYHAHPKTRHHGTIVCSLQAGHGQCSKKKGYRKCSHIGVRSSLSWAQCEGQWTCILK
jgi:hypothetical protein